ncbi:hypothetical protein FA15DRAFT_666663 [Coprinopsis marcescibilis]|uniref:histidine kinase n=1 Tax=Coprinopsis marcescibilis TaxID=230819 RepID=A0A5C3L2E8_COPMA|nr:hypothetical protein FA15DRAFT_666663 [Coprinopsis marcescibilis]
MLVSSESRQPLADIALDSEGRSLIPSATPVSPPKLCDLEDDLGSLRSSLSSRHSFGRLHRPSTAPSQMKAAMLPSGPCQTVSLPSSPYQEIPPQTGKDKDSDRLLQINGSPYVHDDPPPLGNSTLVGSDSFKTSQPSSSSHETQSITPEQGYDWATFISAYAQGQWDPHKPPNQPRSFYNFRSETPSVKQNVHASSLDTQLRVPVVNIEAAEPQKPRQSGTHRNATQQDYFGSTITASPNSFYSLKPEMLIKLPVSAHRSRNSFSSISSLASTSGSTLSNADIQTTVAAMRWAASRVDISPLALPSPEHELVDPMRGIVTTVPGSHPVGEADSVDTVVTPGGSRRSRLPSFWQGTVDVDAKDLRLKLRPRRKSLLRMSTKASSSEGTPGTSPTSSLAEPTSQISILAAQPPPPPASVPILDKRETNGTADYFGDYHTKISDYNPPLVADRLVDVQVTASDPMPGRVAGSLTVPALPRRICLTRQSSSPLPINSFVAPENRGGRYSSDSVKAIKTGRAAKEEQMFAELGYLAPPNPPDELERRRALYKFNIWNTDPDVNFDRIAHLAKLVFNTKGVFVSLIDGNEQWFKSEWGVKSPSCPRMHSLDGHAILQQGDEPMMVLDTHLDWRFANNPLVTDSPHIRFYAGAPLRTQDGFNIGTLALIDDVPREDFSPRQRHTLKEFAAIAMREMELWRDKIQLRIRDRIQDSMERFSRECLEIDTDLPSDSHKEGTPITGTSMDRVYDRAAKLVQRTLDVEGVIVMDVTHCEVLETMGAEGNVTVVLHHGGAVRGMETQTLLSEDHHSLNNFFARYPEGKIVEGILPSCFRQFMPTHIRYALIVPIFNVDKRPFALICAYNTNVHSKRFLEGHELSYLRAIGVIILSAVLKRRMMLADKAKGLFISNISHELRTPLHGILAAAELLSESHLNHSQMSFIQTVQACGTSLVETVNHVLDFTKLSGNSKSGGVDNVIIPTTSDLAQLIEEAVDGSWIGHKARTAILSDSGIGSVYSPPSGDSNGGQQHQGHVETVLDIGYREQGWLLKFEKGGIRRVLMNLFGNSLKFTTDGYVLVRLRLLPSLPSDPPNKTRLELAIEDTGKGISQNFLKNQLFHPFSQENPLQTGTGLGLAIVSSIVTSENVDGKVDVWSEEGVGTDIRVVFPAEIAVDDVRQPEAAQEVQPLKQDHDGTLPTVTMLGFESTHKGVQLLKRVLSTYIHDWWGLELLEGPGLGDIVILNEHIAPVQEATSRRDISRPYVILWAARGNPTVLSVATEYERIGGFCRILYKPSGPSKLRAILKLCMHAIKIGRYRDLSPLPAVLHPASSMSVDGDVSHGGFVLRRNSDQSDTYGLNNARRPPIPRSTTAYPSTLRHQLRLSTISSSRENSQENIVQATSPTNGIQEHEHSLPIVPVGLGGSLLQSAIQTNASTNKKVKVLVVEDNTILRNLLAKWLNKKGYEFEEAVDGQAGVTAFEKNGPFDVALIDLSMPVLDGVAATYQIRRVESMRSESALGAAPPTKILALTGMSSIEDKRRAFEAGVDGYLVKPVAFKTLDETFLKLGISS